MTKVRTLVVAGAMAVTGLLPWGSGAGAGDIYRFTYREDGRALNENTGQLPMTAGQMTVLTNYVVEAQSSFGWHHHENHAPGLLIVKRGSMVEYTSCTEKQVLVTGRAYLHQAGDHGQHHRPTLLRNEGQEPAEIEVVYFDGSTDNPSGIEGRPDAPPAECPTLY
jgi:hypothetical protein